MRIVSRHALCASGALLGAETMDRMTALLDQVVTTMGRAGLLGEGTFEMRTETYREMYLDPLPQLVCVLTQYDTLEAELEARGKSFPYKDQVAALDQALEGLRGARCALFPEDAKIERFEWPAPTGFYQYRYDDVLKPLTCALNTSAGRCIMVFSPNVRDYDSAQHQHFTALALFYAVARAIAATNPDDRLLRYDVAGMLRHDAVKPAAWRSGTSIEEFHLETNYADGLFVHEAVRKWWDQLMITV